MHAPQAWRWLERKIVASTAHSLNNFYPQIVITPIPIPVDTWLWANIYHTPCTTGQYSQTFLTKSRNWQLNSYSVALTRYPVRKDSSAARVAQVALCKS